MTLLLMAAFLVIVSVGILLAVFVPARRVALRKRVMVNLTDDKAIGGVLWSRKGGYVVLKDATLHVRGTDPTPIDGEVLVDRSRVDFVQVL